MTSASAEAAVVDLPAAPMIAPLGVYVHVPFCAAICNYCNFNRGLLDEALKARYVDALVREIGRYADGSAVDTIYFGGGTPSLLSPVELRAVVDACRAGFALDPRSEITLEANPETTSPAYLAAAREAGITRLSIGVQSFDDDELARLGRQHSAARARQSVAHARTAGFDNISLDLMMWLPSQDLASWRRSVEALIALAPEHASLYLLEIYPNAPLRQEMARAGWRLAPDETAADMYLQGFDLLEAAGYRQYEISNVARHGRFARHNLKYWTDGEWLGIGCGAHGTRHDIRWRNVSSASDYVDRLAAGGDARAETRVLSPEDRVAELLIMGLRLNGGVETDAVKRRYGCDLGARYGGALAPYAAEGLVTFDDKRISLTRRGMLVANEILSVFV